MNNCRKLIDRISQLLTTGDAKDRQAVEPLAIQYVAMVNKANQRLQRCAAYLDEGNRSEAIRECEEAPNLLDLYAMLNFPQKDIWEATISFHGLAPPDRLSEAIAQDLNEAYDQEDEIGSLLKTHRLLALARCPLSERLPVLRALSRAEPNALHWETDVRTMEKARLAEIEKEVTQAFQKRDANRLLILERELSDSPWLEMPSSSLQNNVTNYSTTIRVETAKQELLQLEKQLNAAYSAQDVAAGRLLRSKWQAKLRIAALAPGDPLLQEAADALRWLAEEDTRDKADNEYRQAMAALTEALDLDASRSHIERLYAAFVRFDREIPETLNRRVKERLDYLEHATNRRMKMILVLGVSVVLALGAVTWFSLSRHRFNQQVAGHLKNVETLLSQKRLDEADAYFKKIEVENPAIFASPEIQRTHSEWAEATRKENLRVKNFNETIKEIEDHIKKGDWESLLAAERSLKALDKKAQSGSETKTVEDLTGEVATKMQTIQDNINGQYKAKFDTWKQKVSAVDHKNLDALSELEREGWDLLKAGQASTPPISMNYQSLTTDLARKIKVWHQTASQALEANKALRELNESVGNAKQFSSLLQQYRTRFLAEKDTGESNPDMDAYAKIQQVNALLKKVSENPLSKLTPNTARQMISECEACQKSLEDCVGHPLQKISPQYMQSPLSQYIRVLEPIADRKEDGAWITDELNSVLGRPLIIRLKSVLVHSGSEDRQYYFRDKPHSNKGSSSVAWNFKAFVDFDLEDTKSVRFDQANIANTKLDMGTDGAFSFDWEAPQKKIADILVSRANQIKQGGDWEREFAEALAIIHTEPHLEPLLEIQLLQIVADIAAKGSVFLQTALKPELKLLENPPVDFNANWIDPTDEDGKNARAQAELILSQVRDLKSILNKAVEERDAFEANLDKRLEWVGYLWKNEASGDWECRSADISSTPPGDLYVLIPPSDETDKSKMAIKRIGQVSRHATMQSISLTVSSSFSPGRPVYLLRAKELSK